jgi:hypothetical protein
LAGEEGVEEEFTEEKRVENIFTEKEGEEEGVGKKKRVVVEEEEDVGSISILVSFLKV